MPAEATIRDAVDADLRVLRSIYRRASLSNDGDRAALLANPESLVWDASTLSAGCVRVLIVEGGAVAGFATTLLRGKVAELEDLFVDPDAMRRGFGLRLVLDATRVAETAGCSALAVTANPHAQAFYKVDGFRVDGLAKTRFGAGSRMSLAFS